MTLVVRSGGQSGADLAGWRAAKLAGLPTIGWMPKGFLTEDGLRPEYAELYGACETESRDYLDRNRRNVRDSDATIIFRSCRAKSHKGSDKTKDYCVELNKAYIIVPVWSVPDSVIKTAALAERIAKYKFRCVNIAGSRASSDPGEPGKPWTGIEEFVFSYLLDVFTLLKEPTTNG